ncbi:hypothetical protein HOLleu_43460 [Holothuria leucospilota]|uniref:Uncharacterized protein n=1 Tax=Holothuria leucospilota TaxID=206669 RepID=A0A9Q0YGY3_HOLLE|nr:hypothetical protein HOLleu_43460 [Holothuria leucospilota]
MTSGQEIPVISVTDEEYASIKQEILELKYQQLQSLSSEHIYSGTEVASDIPSSTIDTILANLHMAFTYSQFCAQYALPNVDMTNQIWAILTKHLGAKFESSQVEESPCNADSSSEEDEEIIEEELLLAEAEYEEPILHSSESD